MSATARKNEIPGVVVDPDGLADASDLGAGQDSERGGTHLRMVSPLRADRASRGVFVLLITGLLVAGMLTILVINTTLAQGAFTVSTLQAQQATLSQQEQTLSEAVAASAAPDALEKSARALGMVPSQTPVFLNVRNGRVIGKPKAAPGAKANTLKLLTPADATVTEAVDNAAVGTDLPIAPGVNYDPAAADAAARQAEAANAASPAATALRSAGPAAAVAAIARTIVRDKKLTESSLWTTTDINTSQLSTDDSGLVAVPVR